MRIMPTRTGPAEDIGKVSRDDRAGDDRGKWCRGDDTVAPRELFLPATTPAADRIWTGRERAVRAHQKDARQQDAGMLVCHSRAWLRHDADLDALMADGDLWRLLKRSATKPPAIENK